MTNIDDYRGVDGNTPVVSIIVPCYNQAAFLPEALNSVIEQTYADWEVIIINDGSTDNTAEVAGRYVVLDNRIRLVNQENMGVSAARNVGLREARGKYIVALDGDDIIAPQYIEKTLKMFSEENDTDVAYTQWGFFGVNDKAPELKYMGYRQLLVNNTVYCSAMYRREDALRIGGYDENMHTGFEDWEFFIRLLDEHSKVVQIPETLFFYRIKDVSRNTVANEREAEVDFYIYKKHLDVYRRLWGDPIGIYREYAKYSGEIEFERIKNEVKRSPDRAEAWAITNRYVKGDAKLGSKMAMLAKFVFYKLLK